MKMFLFEQGDRVPYCYCLLPLRSPPVPVTVWFLSGRRKKKQIEKDLTIVAFEQWII